GHLLGLRGALCKNHLHSHSKSPPNKVPSASRRIFASMYSKAASTETGSRVGICELLETRRSDSSEITYGISGRATRGCAAYLAFAGRSRRRQGLRLPLLFRTRP